MENGDLELGNMIQKSVKSLLYRVRGEENHANRYSPLIYMAPSVLRDVSPSCFTPRVVSIGPLHRQDENVQAFEKKKIIYMINLMSHMKSSQEGMLESCMQKVYASMDRIKACYDYTMTYYDAEIAEMMVIDACFILEFMLQICESYEKLYSGRMLLLQNMLHDLVLLENQIPLFVLDQIFKCTILEFKPEVSLKELMLPVLCSHNLFEANMKTNNVSIDTAHHILGLLHQCYAPQDNTNITSCSSSSTISSAMNLDTAGIKFKPNQNPTLRMPVLHVDDATEFVLRNLIAYEQLCQTRNYITSYAMAMDMLVNTQEDVAKLVYSRVLVNDMGSNEEAANMINSICKNTTCVDFFYEELWGILNMYCNSYWPKHIARMRRTYFNSPLSMIALLAGIIIFALTVIQTIFTVKSTENKKY